MADDDKEKRDQHYLMIYKSLAEIHRQMKFIRRSSDELYSMAREYDEDKADTNSSLIANSLYFIQDATNDIGRTVQRLRDGAW